MYIFMYIVSCYDVKDVPYSFSKSVHLHKLYLKMAGGIERRGGHPNHKKVVARGMLKSAIKSMHWKVALKQQVQPLFSI